MNGFDLLKALKSLGHIQEQRDPWWWPRSGTFDVVVGALLTQQTRWEKVEDSLTNLRQAQCLSLPALAAVSEESLRELVRPSGFYNTKAARLIKLARNIQEEYGDFDTFRQHVTRQWLLAQTGIGKETADSILCYACHREVMVADAYSARLLNALNISAPDYDAVQTWLADGLTANRAAALALYEEPLPLAQILARFHGKIVEYCKRHSSGSIVNSPPLIRGVRNLPNR